MARCGRFVVVILVALVGGGGGCAADPEALPFCGAGAPPEPSAPCLAEPEVEAYAAGLASRIEPEAGPLRVRVRFDEGASVTAVCAERAPAEGRWRARLRVGARLDEILAGPPGPACLAGARLDFNHAGARRAETEALMRSCEREGRARLESDRRSPVAPDVHAEGEAGLAFLECLDFHQVNRGEVWFFESLAGDPRVFVRAGDHAAERREVLIECSDVRERLPRDSLQPRIGRARVHPRLAQCLAERGWQPAF